MNNQVNFFEVFSAAIAIATALVGAAQSVLSGQGGQVPPIRTYIAGRHVEVDISVKPL